MSLLNTATPPTPSPKEIATAVPLRTEVRSSVLKQYTLFTQQTPIYYEAGLTYWQLRPMTNFLNSEIAWWNANIELTTQQITTRKISYTETYASLQKDLQANLTTALSALDGKTAQNIVNQLNRSVSTDSGSAAATSGSRSAAPSGSGSGSSSIFNSVFGSRSGSAAPSGSGSSSIFNSVFGSKAISGFVDISDSIPDSSGTIPLPKTPVDTLKLQEAVNSIHADSVKANTLVKTTYSSMSDAASTAVTIIFTFIYLAIALRFAGFTTSELLYKPLSYRVLAFFYTILFTPILFPYFIYREIRHVIFPSILTPRFESIFPIVPYDPQSPLTINNRLYGYADTPGINTWISNMRTNETAERTKVLNTNILQSLLASRS